MARRFAKIINYLPDSIAGFIARKIVNGYIDKYANIIVEGEENLQGIKNPIIFVSNHLSNSDALVLNRVLKSKDPIFMAGVKLSKDHFTNLGRYLVKTITIKPNSADKDAISNAIKCLKSGSNIVIFPEGTRSRTSSMIEGKKGVVLIQKLSKATVVPVAIHGSEKLMPIDPDGNMSNERFYYSDVFVKIGKAIEIPKKNTAENKHQHEDRVLNVIMKGISSMLPESYRGVYGDDK